MSSSDTPGIYSEVSKSIRTKAEETQQLQDRARATRTGAVRRPPVNPVTLAKLLEENVTHAKCCFSKSRNTAGHGIDLKPHPNVDNPSDDQRQTAEDFWFGSDSRWIVDPEHQEHATPSDVLELAWLDFETIGWLSLEKLTALDGTPTGLAWLPAMTMRKRRTHDSDGVKQAHGYVQVIDAENRYFGVAGDQYNDDRMFVDRDTGAFGNEVDAPANEVIWKNNKSLLHPHYGTPDVLPARLAMRGKKAAEKYNVEFFENDGVPRLAVIVEGGQLTERASDTIENLLTESKDGESHRTLFLEVEKLADNPEMINLDDGADRSDVNIRIEPLTVGMDEDASFLDYQEATQHDLLQAHEVPPVIAGVLKSGAFSTDTDEQRKEFSETISQKQEAFAGLLHETIHKPLGVTDWIPSFKTRGLENRSKEIEMASQKIEALQGAVPLGLAMDWLGEDPADVPDEFENMLISEITGGMGGMTSEIQSMVENATDEARKEGERQGRLDYMVENSPEN